MSLCVEMLARSNRQLFGYTSLPALGWGFLYGYAPPWNGFDVLTVYRLVEVCWVLPDVLTDMRGRCLYLGSHPGSVLNVRRPL